MFAVFSLLYLQLVINSENLNDVFIRVHVVDNVVVADRTALKVHFVRTWEQQYQTITSGGSEARRRLTDESHSHGELWWWFPGEVCMLFLLLLFFLWFTKPNIIQLLRHFTSTTRRRCVEQLLLPTNQETNQIAGGNNQLTDRPTQRLRCLPVSLSSRVSDWEHATSECCDTFMGHFTWSNKWGTYTA